MEAIIPRRPYYDDQPDGYMESDKDYVLNNIGAAIELLDRELGHPVRRPFPAGCAVLSINGEFDDNDGVERHTGPMAIGVIHDSGYHKDTGWTYSVWFANGTCVQIYEFELMDASQYAVGVDICTKLMED